MTISSIVAGITAFCQGVSVLHKKVFHAAAAVFRGNLERANYPGFEPKVKPDEKEINSPGSDDFPCGEC